MPHGMGQAVQEARKQWLWTQRRRRGRSRLGEILSARKHDLTSSHQGSAQRTRPEQLLPEQRSAGEGKENPKHHGYTTLSGTLSNAVTDVFVLKAGS